MHPRVVLWGLRVPAAVVASLTPGLVEIRAVALRNVAIKGVQSLRYLCMGGDGRMLGLVGVATRREALWQGLRGRGARWIKSRLSWLPPPGPAGALRRRLPGSD